MLDAYAIAGAVSDQLIGAEVRCVGQVGSTNDEVRLLAEKGAVEGLALFAESQTAGRGRRGADWVDTAGLNILGSILLRPSLPLPEWTRFTPLSALAVCHAIEAVSDLKAQVKWPNDVYIDGRKIAGILLESVVGTPRGAFGILGIGINVNMARDDFPLELRDAATSLAVETGNAFRREEIAMELLRTFDALYRCSEVDLAVHVAEVERRCLFIGERISASAHGGVIEGVALGLGPSGELRVQSGSGAETLLTNATEVRLMN